MTFQCSPATSRVADGSCGFQSVRAASHVMGTVASTTSDPRPADGTTEGAPGPWMFVGISWMVHRCSETQTVRPPLSSRAYGERPR